MYQKRFILITVIWLLYVWQPAYAEFWSNDCKIVMNWVDKGIDLFKNDVKSQWNPLVDEDTIGQAVQNLSNSCNKVVWWVESNYIFDHLVDLSFRRLDAYIDPALRYNLDADTKWKEWQDLVTKFATPSNNTKPEQIIQAFSSYRPLVEQAWTTYVYSSTCDIPNTDKLSLYWRYKAACSIAKCLSEKRVLVTQNPSDETSAVRLKKEANICDQLTSNRYEAEVSYMRQLVARAGIRTINNLVEQYTKNYFVWNRRQNLYEQFTSFNQNLSFVNRKIQEGTPVCSAK